MKLSDFLIGYWSVSAVDANAVIFLNLFGALLLGLMVGYERSYHGRAAGMRTYGLVCMASAALTVIIGYPGFWFGGHFSTIVNADPTRVIQGIVTGIGFLGAGVIMKEGFTISGLTTAASIWASSAIGVMVGVGFYAAAILLALLSILCMTLVSQLEAWLPSRHALAIVLRFKKDCIPQEGILDRILFEQGYKMAKGTISVGYQDGKPEWQFVAIGRGNGYGVSVPELTKGLRLWNDLESFHLTHARN